MTFYSGLIFGLLAGAALTLLTVCCLIEAGRDCLSDAEVEKWHEEIESWRKN